MRKNCYNLFAEMGKLTIDEVYSVYSSIELFSLLPIAESITRKKGCQIHKAAAKDIKYPVLVIYSVFEYRQLYL